MIDALFDYICEMDELTEMDLITRSEDIINSFVEEFGYTYEEVKQYYYKSIIPQVKRNIIEDKINDLETDFKV